MSSPILSVTLFVLVFMMILLVLKFVLESRTDLIQIRTDSIIQQKQFPFKGCRDAPRRCEIGLNERPVHVAAPSHTINEVPEFVNFPSVCQNKPKPNIELAEMGTVAEPAFAGKNEFAAPFQSSPSICNPKTNTNFDPQPSDDANRIDSYGAIDYKVNLPDISGFACSRPGGVGEPAFEKKNEFPAHFDSQSKIDGCSSCEGPKVKTFYPV